mgnify:CR=1 FL=1
MFNPMDFLTSGVTKTVESVALEWIDTKKETAEAQAVMVKALAPNGKMRRDISKTLCFLYSSYVAITAVLIIFQAFDISTTVTIGDEVHRSVDLAANNLTSLFAPVTALFGTITTASFGVNATNSAKGK